MRQWIRKHKFMIIVISVAVIAVAILAILGYFKVAALILGVGAVTSQGNNLTGKPKKIVKNKNKIVKETKEKLNKIKKQEEKIDETVNNMDVNDIFNNINSNHKSRK